MRLRTSPAAMRYYKGKESNHEYFYSEIFLYTPFRKESNSILNPIKGLREFYEDEDKCRDFYNSGKVQKVKEGVMEHLESVVEGRRRVEESEEANEVVGSVLDAYKEQENADSKREGVIDHPEHYALDPGELLDKASLPKVDQAYRKIELKNFDKLALHRINVVIILFVIILLIEFVTLKRMLVITYRCTFYNRQCSKIKV